MSDPTIGVTVLAIRFSTDLGAMDDFLQTLGLRPHTASVSGRWREYVDPVRGVRGGVVAVHDAAVADDPTAAGRTSLAFRSTVAPEELADCLDAAGHPASVVDEAWGRDVHVTDPSGAVLTVGTDESDRYGYRDLAAPAAGSSTVTGVLTVVPIRPAGDLTAQVGLLAVLGGRATGDDTWTRVDLPGGGAVGLHRSDDTPVGRADVTLAFTSTEDLDDLAARLVAAGHRASVAHEDWGDELTVVDPDGQRCHLTRG